MKNKIIAYTLALTFAVPIFFLFKRVRDNRNENIKLIGKKIILLTDTVVIMDCDETTFYLSNGTEINRLHLGRFKVID